MTYRPFTLYTLLLCLLMLALSSCKTEPGSEKKTSINIHLSKDPAKLHPIYNSSSTAREVLQYIHLPVADYHPETLELYPILIKNIPKGTQVDDNTMSYDLEFLEDAAWGDGTPITGEDYKFTVKAALHPATSPRVWKTYFNDIKDITIDPEDPKKITVRIDASSFLKLETVIGLFLVPKHRYANAALLDNLSFRDIKKIDPEEMDNAMKKFVADFEDQKHYTNETLGAGPYQLASWNTDQNLKLTAKESYWGDKIDNVYMSSGIDTLNFKIIKDENTILTAFKDGALDIAKSFSANNYNDLKANYSEFDFDQAQIMRYYYIAINNQHPILKDKEVRKALNLLLDVDTIIEKIEQGYATATDGPVHPTKPYYTDNFENIEFNVELAKEVLLAAGWMDKDEDGILDKFINGQSTPLALDILITGSDLGKNIALILKNEAQKAGVEITVVPKDIRRMLNENIYNYSYDMAALVQNQDLGPYDPYVRWHSDNIKEKGSNILAFNNQEIDSLCESIRNEEDQAKRNEAYKEFQQIIHSEYPCIFLYAPKEKFAFGKGIEGTVSAKRPGYMANTFKANVVR